MYGRNFFLSSTLILLTIHAVGCTSVNYFGNSFDSTTTVDLYLSKEEIKSDYTVIGHALGTGTLWASNDKIQKELINEAQKKGADAILITGLGQSHISIGGSGSSVSQITASFLKYQ